MRLWVLEVNTLNVDSTEGRCENIFRVIVLCAPGVACVRVGVSGLV
jgi:hypothetical protein